MDKKIIPLIVVSLFFISIFTFMNLAESEKDGFLIVGYEKVYAQKTIQKPIYEEKEVTVKSAYNETTDSWSKEYTYTEQVLIGYEEVNISTKRQIGVVVDEVKYLNANVKNDMLVRWTVPIGDRNFEEYGRCRAYEIEKGVCSEVKLI